MKLLAVEIVGFGKWQQQKLHLNLVINCCTAQMKLASPHCINSFKQCCLGFPQRAKRDYAPKMVARMVVVCGWHILCLGKFKSSVLKEK